MATLSNCYFPSYLQGDLSENYEPGTMTSTTWTSYHVSPCATDYPSDYEAPPSADDLTTTFCEDANYTINPISLSSPISLSNQDFTTHPLANSLWNEQASPSNEATMNGNGFAQEAFMCPVFPPTSVPFQCSPLLTRESETGDSPVTFKTDPGNKVFDPSKTPIQSESATPFSPVSEEGHPQRHVQNHDSTRGGRIAAQPKRSPPKAISTPAPTPPLDASLDHYPQRRLARDTPAPSQRSPKTKPEGSKTYSSIVAPLIPAGSSAEVLIQATKVPRQRRGRGNKRVRDHNEVEARYRTGLNELFNDLAGVVLSTVDQSITVMPSGAAQEAGDGCEGSDLEFTLVGDGSVAGSGIESEDGAGCSDETGDSLSNARDLRGDRSVKRKSVSPPMPNTKRRGSEEMATGTTMSPHRLTKKTVLRIAQTRILELYSQNQKMIQRVKELEMREERTPV